MFSIDIRQMTSRKSNDPKSLRFDCFDRLPNDMLHLQMELLEMIYSRSKKTFLFLHQGLFHRFDAVITGYSIDVLLFLFLIFS